MTQTTPIHTLGLPVRVRTQTGGLWASIQTWLIPALVFTCCRTDGTVPAGTAWKDHMGLHRHLADRLGTSRTCKQGSVHR
jgi:hypothetical protein